VGAWAPGEARRSPSRRIAHRIALFDGARGCVTRSHAVLTRNLIEVPVIDVFGQAGRR